MTSKNNITKNSSFWNNWIIVVISISSILIPLILIIVAIISNTKILGYSLNLGFDIANTIALLAAGIAIFGTLYSNYRNDVRNQIQIIGAEKRLEEQLIFDKERNVMLKIYDIFFKNQISINNNLENMDPNDPNSKWNAELNKVIIGRDNIYLDLNKIIRDIQELYYIPQPIQEKILEFIGYIDENIERVNNEDYGTARSSISPRKKGLYYDDENHKTQKYLEELSVLIEEYLEISINR